jgi:hypothetical protein
MSSDWQKEIVELHEFFQGWLGGALEPADKAFRRLEKVLGGDFALITPDGRCLEREPLLQSLRDGAGARPGLEIWIEEPRLYHETKTHLIAGYQEWQRERAGTRGRLSTVVFHRRKTLPNGLEWLHVHETWLQGQLG